MSDSGNIGPNTATQPPPLDTHDGATLHLRMYNNTTGFEAKLLGTMGRGLDDWFSMADFVIRDPKDTSTVTTQMGGVVPVGFLRFQDGPIKEVGINGVQVEHLIDLCWMRLMLLGSMHGGPDEETTKAIENLKSAGRWLQSRKIRREAAGTEGTPQVVPLTMPGGDETEGNFDGGGYDETPAESADQGEYENKP